MIEEWRPVQGYEGLYSVSNLGRVRTHDRIVAAKLGSVRRLAGRLLKGDRNITHGYVTQVRVSLCKNGVKKRILVHHLVLNAFVGPCPEGMECRHLDGNAENNIVTNLAWGTHKENSKDKFRYGRAYVYYSTNTSGVTGISYDKRLKKWHTYIGYAPRENLGWFSNFEDAVRVRRQAEKRVIAARTEGWPHVVGMD